MSEKIILAPLDAVIGDIMAYEEEGEIGYWKINGFASWEIEPAHGGTYDVYMLASCGENQGGTGRIQTPCGSYDFTVYETASFSNYHYICCKGVQFCEGKQEIKILPVKLKQLFFMALREAVILPAGTTFDKPVLSADIPRRRTVPAEDMHKIYQGKNGRELYKFRLDKMLAEYDLKGGKQVTFPGGFWHGLAILCRTTGEKSYFVRAAGKVRRWIKIYIKTGKLPQYNFPSKIGIIELIEQAQKSGILTEEECAAGEEMIKTLAFNSVYEGGGVMNRNIGYCLGIAAAKEHILSDSRYPLLKEMTDNLNEELEQTCEPLENSTNYEDITLMYMINYIEKAGLSRLYNTDKMRNTFYSLLNKLTQECGLSCYGDYGGKEKFSVMFAAVLEAAARIYNDGKFAYAAAQMCRRASCMRIDPADEPELNGWDFIGLAHAYEWCADITPEPPQNCSCITRRNDGQPDKAVFKSGDLFMMMDLMNGCEHGCNNALAVMSVVKGGKNALFDMAHRDEANHCKIFARRSDENFPKVTKPDGEWEEGALRLSNYWSWGVFNNAQKRYHSSLKNGINDLLLDGCETDYDPEREFLFAVFSWHRFQLPYRDKPKKGRVYMKNLRLTGTDGNELLLDGGRTEVFDADSEKQSVFYVKVFNMPLDIRCGRYEYLKFDIKTEGLLAKDLMISLGDNTYYPHNYPMFLNPMNPVRVLYFRQNERASAAGFELENEDSVQKREVAFSGRGIWIKDTITVKSGRIRTVGNGWRFDEIKKLSDTCYLTKSDCEMYAEFSEPPEVIEDGINVHESHIQHNKYVLCCKSRGTGGFTFDTWLYFDRIGGGFDRMEYSADGFIIEENENGGVDR